MTDLQVGDIVRYADNRLLHLGAPLLGSVWVVKGFSSGGTAVICNPVFVPERYARSAYVQFQLDLMEKIPYAK